jgi:hypothetical protein
MFSRLLTVALLTAGTAFALATAQAQTSGSGTGSSTMSPSTTSPSTTSPSTISPSTGSPSTGTPSSTQQAQQPMTGGSFKASDYKTKTECLNAAAAQKADRLLCNSLP